MAQARPRKRQTPAIETVESVQPVPAVTPAVQAPPSLLTDFDLYLFNEGSHHDIYRKLGAHPIEHDGVRGTYFAVWAPNASAVSVIGDFNGWDANATPLNWRGSAGIAEGFVKADGKLVYEAKDLRVGLFQHT